MLCYFVWAGLSWVSLPREVITKRTSSGYGRMNFECTESLQVRNIVDVKGTLFHGSDINPRMTHGRNLITKIFEKTQKLSSSRPPQVLRSINTLAGVVHAHLFRLPVLTEHDVGEVFGGVNLAIAVNPRLLLGRPGLRRLVKHRPGACQYRPHRKQQAPDEKEQHPRDAEEEQVRRAHKNGDSKPEPPNEALGGHYVGE